MYPITEQMRDDLLAQRILGALASRGRHETWPVDCTTARGVVALRGRMPTAQSKRLCVELCRRVPGIARLEDALEVQAELQAGAAENS